MNKEIIDPTSGQEGNEIAEKRAKIMGILQKLRGTLSWEDEEALRGDLERAQAELAALEGKNSGSAGGSLGAD